MVINKRKVRADILLYTSSQFLYKLVGYGVLMMLTRHLSQDRMGEFFLAASLAGVTAMLAELGTNSYMTRSLASRADERVTIFSEVISFQIPLMLVLFAILNGAVWFIKPHILGILALTSVYIILEQIYLAFGALFVGMHRVSYNVICGVAAKLFLIVLVAVAVNRQFTLNGILLCYITANLVLLGIALYLSRRVIRGVRFQWEPKEVRRFVGIALSFFGIGLLGTIHFSADTLMLGTLSTLVAVATYETAFKLLEAARFVIRAVYTIYFPVFATLAQHEKWDDVRRQLNRLLALAGGGGLLLSVFVFFTAHWIIPFIFGPQYSASVPVLIILYICLPVFYVSQIGSLVANALGFERQNLIITTSAVVLNIVLNLIVIPRYGPIGAAWTTVISHTYLAVVLAFTAYRKLGERSRIAAGTGV